MSTHPDLRHAYSVQDAQDPVVHLRARHRHRLHRIGGNRCREAVAPCLRVLIAFLIGTLHLAGHLAVDVDGYPVIHQDLDEESQKSLGYLIFALARCLNIRKF